MLQVVTYFNHKMNASRHLLKNILMKLPVHPLPSSFCLFCPDNAIDRAKPEHSSYIAFVQRYLRLLRLPAFLFIAFAAVLAAPSSAYAQAGNMLFLSTNEASNPNTSQRATATAILNNAWGAFQAEATANGLTPINGQGALSSTTTPLDFTNVKLVVVVTIYLSADPNRMAELINALETQPNLAIVIFSESCSTCTQNLQQLMAGVDAIQPADWPTLGLGTANTANYSAPLNMASLYASTFFAAGLDPLVAGNYTPITNVPFDYALYTQTALPSPPPSTVATNVVGLFIPQAASNNGQGACLFLTADASEFTNSHPTQYAPIAQAFTNAALDPAGACVQPVAGVPDLWPTLTGLTSLEVNTASDVTLMVSNADQLASPATQVTVTLPIGINLVGSPPSGCSATVSGFTCPVPALSAGSSVNFDFQIIAPNPISNVALSATVAPISGEINTGNNSTDRLVSAPGYPDLVSSITGPELLPVGSSGTYTVIVTNQGNLDSDDGTVNITLPAGTTINPSSLPRNCTAITDTSLTCALPGIVQGKNVTIRLTVTATEAFTDHIIQVQVTGVSGQRLAAPGSQKELSAAVLLSGSLTGTQPVPSLDAVALALLALIVAGGAAVRLPRKG